jgi:hypothetical protein
MYGSHLLAATMDYCFDFNSHLSREVYYTERTSVKVNMVYAHAWILGEVNRWARNQGNAGWKAYTKTK